MILRKFSCPFENSASYWDLIKLVSKITENELPRAPPLLLIFLFAAYICHRQITLYISLESFSHADLLNQSFSPWRIYLKKSYTSRWKTLESLYIFVLIRKYALFLNLLNCLEVVVKDFKMIRFEICTLHALHVSVSKDFGAQKVLVRVKVSKRRRRWVVWPCSLISIDRCARITRKTKNKRCCLREYSQRTFSPWFSLIVLQRN